MSASSLQMCIRDRDSADEKVIGKRLQEIAKNATTGGLYTQVGELYGFPIKVVSERILKEEMCIRDSFSGRSESFQVHHFRGFLYRGDL